MLVAPAWDKRNTERSFGKEQTQAICTLGTENLTEPLRGVCNQPYLKDADITQVSLQNELEANHGDPAHESPGFRPSCPEKASNIELTVRVFTSHR